MWFTITREEARKKLASYRKIKELYTLVSPGGEIAVVFGVKPLAGFLGEDYKYVFGAIPVSPENDGQASLLLHITAAGKTAKLAFSPDSVHTLMDAHRLLLLAAARPQWLATGHLMNTATAYKLAASGNVSVDLSNENIRRELKTYGAIVLLEEKLMVPQPDGTV